MKKKLLCFGLAVAAFFTIAPRVAGATMGSDRSMADDRIADLSGNERGSGASSGGTALATDINSLYQQVV